MVNHPLLHICLVPVVREDGKPGATDAGGAAAATSPAAFYGLLLSLAVLYVAV